MTTTQTTETTTSTANDIENAYRSGRLNTNELFELIDTDFAAGNLTTAEARYLESLAG